MLSRFSFPVIRAALIGFGFALLSPAEPASAMCGGNIFMTCSKVAKAGAAQVGPRRPLRPHRKPVVAR